MAASLGDSSLRGAHSTESLRQLSRDHQCLKIGQGLQKRNPTSVGLLMNRLRNAQAFRFLANTPRLQMLERTSHAVAGIGTGGAQELVQPVRTAIASMIGELSWNSKL